MTDYCFYLVFMAPSAPFQILAYKNAFPGCYKVPRSPTPHSAKLYSRSESETKRKTLVHDDRDIPISFLADSDSMFIACQGVTVHYKMSDPSSCISPAPELSPETNHDAVSSSISPRRQRHESPPTASSSTRRLLHRSFSHQYHQTSLYAPLLVEPLTSPTVSDGIPFLSLDDGSLQVCSKPMGFDLETGEHGKFAVVLVHGFGGGVFAWRHVRNLLARQVGCTVLAFDRPGWGLTSRPRRKDWEDKSMPNPYELESQVILLTGLGRNLFVG
uniref:AB hydrolase-1 domain-containing protein n=1 Tax=Aegilops tauschii subsp. strangulata TaxID=200361 RepID=A0A453F4K0_AEGTS